MLNLIPLLADATKAAVTPAVDAAAEAVAALPIPENVTTDVVYRYGQFAVTEAGLKHAGIVIGVFVVISIVLKTIFVVMHRRLEGRSPIVASAFDGVAKSVHLLLFAGAMRALIPTRAEYEAAKSSSDEYGLLLHFGDWTSVADACSRVLVVVAVTAALLHLVRVPVTWFRILAERTPSKLDDVLVPMAGTTMRILVVLGGVVQLISTLSGSTPAQVMAPLAVGGLAIGLAAQDTVKNVFGSVMLIIDKPFTLGDTVNIGAHEGVVEALGLRSTRLRTSEGHVVSVPNGDLANRTLRNVSQRRFIYFKFYVNVPVRAGSAKVREAIVILKELLHNHEGFSRSNPPRVFLEKRDDWSLAIQVTYWYFPANWWKAMLYNEQLQLRIIERFEAAGIELALPTQSVVTTTLDVDGEKGRAEAPGGEDAAASEGSPV